MKLLIVECFSWTPHLETAGEIALLKKADGNDVAFGFLDVHNPDDDDCSLIAGTLLNRIGARTRSHKVRQLLRALAGFGVRLVDQPSLDASAARRIKHFMSCVPTTAAELKGYSHGGADLGLGIYSSLITRTRHAHPEPADYPALVLEYARAAVTVFEQTRLLLGRERPDAVITFNGRFACARSIAEAARQQGIAAVFHERGALTQRYRLYDKEPHRLDYWKEEVGRHWRERGDAELAAGFFVSHRADNEYTAQQVLGAVPPRSGHRQLVFFSSSDDELEAVPDYSVHRMFPSQRAAVEDLVEWVSERSDVTLMIRVHPNVLTRHPDDREWWHSIKGPNVHVIPGDSEVDSYALMEGADVVITYGSTAGVEATFWGRPSVIVSDAEYAGLGCVYEPTSVSDFHSLLECAQLPAKPREACLPFGYLYATYGTAYRHYAPSGFSTGAFLGETLTLDKPWLTRALGSALVRAARAILGRKGQPA